MAYTEHDKWADDLCERDDVASPLIAEMISDRLNAQADEIERLQTRAEAAEANFATEHHAVVKLKNLSETAWALITNSYGDDWDWASEAPGWKVAAERWRDQYHDLVHPYTREATGGGGDDEHATA